MYSFDEFYNPNILFEEKYNSLFDNNYQIFQETENIVSGTIDKGDINNEIKKPNNFILENICDEPTGITSIKNTALKPELEINKIENFQLNGDQKKEIKNTVQKISQKSKDITDKSLKDKKLLGRKTKNSNETGSHDKYSNDNLSRKCKHIIIGNLLSFINSLLVIIYHNKIGYGQNEKKLFKLDQKQVVNSKAKYNKEFLHKSVKDIFSSEISKKYSNHSLDHNKRLIEELLNEEDKEKRKKFEKIFNLTFLDCLNHFRGKIYIKELEGFDRIEETCKEFEKQYEDYIQYSAHFRTFIDNYEDFIMNLKWRNRKNTKK